MSVRTPRKPVSGSWLVRVILSAAVVLTIVPILWMLLIAFNQPRSIISPGFTFTFSLENFHSILAPGSDYAAEMINSVILVITATTICLIVSTLAGYSLSQLPWPPKLVTLTLISIGLLQVIPPMTLVPGLFYTLTNYHLIGTLPGLILLNIVFNLPFATIMTKFYFDTLPKELRESAALDGATEFATFHRVMLPLAGPGIAAVAIFTAIQIWNEFLFGLVFTTGGTSSPITVGIATLIQPQEIKFGAMAAIGVITAIPIIILTITANRQIITGLTHGAIKG